jgi:tRNA threonylcarbamoyladenosine biosynthesis protein TsaB
MVVLALDTTTKGGSCAVARDGVVLRERPGDGDRGHDARLPADLMALLDAAGLGLAEVDVFAVATGPGSFTGLRIGIATMQGLAFARSKPLIGVSAFDALACTASRGRVATWMDAWRGEVYAALYDDGRESQPPTVQAPAALLRTLRGTPTLFAGEAAATHRQEILDTLGGDARFADPPAPLIAGTIALIAADAVRAGQCPPPHAIRPVYVRRPDPEPAREPRPVG